MTVALKSYGLREAYLFNITDPDTPTYATGVEIDCPTNFQFAKRVTEIIQKGGDKICFVSHDLEGIDFTVESSGVALDIDAIMFGHAIAEDAGPPVSTKLTMTIEDNPGQFGLLCKTHGKGPGGSSHIVLHQCTVNADGGHNQTQQDNLASSTYSGVGYPSAVDGITLGAIQFFDTDVAVDTTWSNNDVVTI